MSCSDIKHESHPAWTRLWEQQILLQPLCCSERQQEGDDHKTTGYQLDRKWNKKVIKTVEWHMLAEWTTMWNREYDFWLCLSPDFTPSWGTGLRCGVLKRCNRILQVSRAPGSESCSLQAKGKIHRLDFFFKYMRTVLICWTGYTNHGVLSHTFKFIQHRLFFTQDKQLLLMKLLVWKRKGRDNSFIAGEPCSYDKWEVRKKEPHQHWGVKGWQHSEPGLLAEGTVWRWVWPQMSPTNRGRTNRSPETWINLRYNCVLKVYFY